MGRCICVCSCIPVPFTSPVDNRPAMQYHGMAIRSHLLHGANNRQFLRWQIIGAFDVITEAALFGMAIYLVLGLRLPIRLKIFVVAAFIFRIPSVCLV